MPVFGVLQKNRVAGYVAVSVVIYPIHRLVKFTVLQNKCNSLVTFFYKYKVCVDNLDTCYIFNFVLRGFFLLMNFILQTLVTNDTTYKKYYKQKRTQIHYL